MKKNGTFTLLTVVVIMAIIAIGCGSKSKSSVGNYEPEENITISPSIEATASVTSVPTETPTATAIPSVTEELTSTPTPEKSEPTNTPTATLTPVPKELNITMYTTARLNVRKSGDISSDKIDTLELGDKVTVVSKYDNGWFEIKYSKDKKGYVFGEYLSERKPEVKPENTPTPKPSNNPTENQEKPETPTPAPSNESDLSMSGCHNTLNNKLANLGKTYTAANKDIISEHIALVNALRAEKGLSALKQDVTLTHFAEYRVAESIALDCFSHYHPGSDNVLCFKEESSLFLTQYKWLGENMSNISTTGATIYDYFSGENYKYDIAKYLFDNLKSSQKHYENMVNSNYTKIGVSVYISENYVLLIQIFANY